MSLLRVVVAGLLVGCGSAPPPDEPSPEPGPPGTPQAVPQARGTPSTASTIGVPPGHLPAVGYCRVWIPGTPPGRQPGPRSRRCQGINQDAPAGSWIVYRPSADRKVVHMRVVDPRRAGVVIKVRIYDVDTERFLREETP